ncbi:MAG: YncE family protein [Longimicrobiaceae bacterium]
MARPAPRRAGSRVLLILSAGALLAACDGTNGWTPTGPPGGGPTGGTDTQAPVVTLAKPDSNANVAVGEAVYVEARVTDNVALDSVQLRAFERRGSVELGTYTEVARFTTKSVSLAGAAAVKDTTLKRFLEALADSSRAQRIKVLVTAWDTAGNSAADSTLINIGGPRAVILSPATGATFFGGTSMQVRVLAADSGQLVRSVRLTGTGAFAFDTTVTLPAPVPQVVDTFTILIPATIGSTVVQGAEELRATVTAASGAAGVSAPVTVTINPAQTDATAPQVTFRAHVPARVEADDSFSVAVSATDETRPDTVGLTIYVIHPRGAAADTVAVLTRKVHAAADSAVFGLASVPLTGLDTLTLRLEVTAWSTDPAGNCGTAVSPDVAQSQACRAGPSGSRLAAAAPGYPYLTLVVRGLTVAPPNPGDLLADLLADSNRVYLSNFTRNQVDVLPIGSLAYGAPVRVGSQPWGLALGRFRDSLYVANSGGTNISVIPLNAGVLAEAQDRRIFTQNEKLFSVAYNAANEEVQSVTSFDYSDRPQFIAQASNGLLVYSTKPTEAAADGTVRIFDPRKTRSEIFTGYVDRHTAGRALAVNADSAFLVPGAKMVMVCPRRRFGDTADPPCIVGFPSFVADSLGRMRSRAPNAAGGKWDTRLDIGANVAEVGLSDTTFVAVSGDRDYVAVGEGAVENARIPLFTAPAGGDSLVLVGDVRDLISNTAERVIGLGLNYDGSLGVARGSQAYYFNESLRLQGVVAAGAPTGGVAMHPANAGYPGGSFRLSFVSGIDATGPYVDVIDNFNFFRVKRIYTRDPVVGAMAVAPRAGADAGSVTLRIYALTSRGILALPITSADLTP